MEKLDADGYSNVRRLVGEISFDFGEDEEDGEVVRLMSASGRD